MNYTVEEQRANCATLLQVLEQVPEESYNHNTYGDVRRDHSGHPCGTVACALGHAALSGKFPIRWSTENNWFCSTEGLEIYGMSRRANDIFGEDAFNHVFCALDEKHQDRNWGIPEAIDALRRHMEDLV